MPPQTPSSKILNKSILTLRSSPQKTFVLVIPVGEELQHLFLHHLGGRGSGGTEGDGFCPPPHGPPPSPVSPSLSLCSSLKKLKRCAEMPPRFAVRASRRRACRAKISHRKPSSCTACHPAADCADSARKRSVSEQKLRPFIVKIQSMITEKHTTTHICVLLRI